MSGTCPNVSSANVFDPGASGSKWTPKMSCASLTRADPAARYCRQEILQDDASDLRSVSRAYFIARLFGILRKGPKHSLDRHVLFSPLSGSRMLIDRNSTMAPLWERGLYEI